MAANYGELAVAGVAFGSVSALSGIGLVVTYRATGVFNFAHGAVATFVAYCYWQMRVQWGWWPPLAAFVAIVVVGPLIGVLLERLVFRPLQTRGASTSEKLVATLGVFVLLVGLCFAIWSGVGRRVPRLFPSGQVNVLGLDVAYIYLGQIAFVLVAGAGLTVLLRATRLGLHMRAVVDKRELAELATIDAARVARAAWALGCCFAGLTGVLLTSRLNLTPYSLTLLVIDTFGVAVAARLGSLPLAVGVGLVLGVTQNFLESGVPFDIFSRAPFDKVPPNLTIVALLAALVLYRRLDEVGDATSTARGIVSGSMGSARAQRRFALGPAAAWLGLSALAPFVLSGGNLVYAQLAVALSVIFVSIVAITGFSGHITLGQAGFAGLGGFFAIKLNAGEYFLPAMPVLLAMLVGALFVVPVGVLVGYPALRRRGLFLGLTTLAAGLVLYRFVFDNLYFRNQLPAINRPHLLGLSLTGERAFFWFELVCLALVLALAANLRRGRLGRILAAMRDSEVGARSVGISLRAYKLFIFAVSSFIAAIGGMLVMQTRGAFDALDFDAIQSLFWFTAVVVAGISSLAGAVLGATLFVTLDAVLGDGSSALIGILALLIGRFPGGLVGLVRRGVRAARTPSALMRTFATADESTEAAALDEPRPSEFAERILAGTAARTR